MLYLFIVLNCVASAVASCHCCVRGMGLAWGLGSMIIFTVPTETYCCFTSSDKCTCCESLWIKASDERPEGNYKRNANICCTVQTADGGVRYSVLPT